MKRERSTVAGCSVVFLAVLLYAIFAVDPAYYYPRLITDQLLYYLKGLSFVHQGTLEARAAVNVEPFVYASGPGLLRAPWMMLFGEFDRQLRAIQLTNLATAWALAVMFAFVFSEILPTRFHPFAIVFSFASVLLNPVWITNVFSPLADLPFAAASMGTIILSRQIIAGSENERASLWRKVLCLLLFVIAFICRFTALALGLYAWMIYRERERGTSRRFLTSRRSLILWGVLLIVVLANLETIIFGYLWQPLLFIARADIGGMILNTISVGIPAQIVPGFELLYRKPPVQRQFHPQFATNQFDSLLLAGGLIITLVVAAGMWSSRRTRRPELAYVLLPLPVLAMIIPSTTRYLLTYQPFFWMFMAGGLVATARRFLPGLRLTRRAITLAALVVVASGASVLYLRSARLTNTGVTFSSFSLGETRRHAPEVAATYRNLRNFIERLPRERTLVINARQRTGQWTAIAGVDHYQLDSAVARAASVKDIYLIVDCPTPATCSDFNRSAEAEQRRVLKFGKFDFEKVFETGSRWSAARVYMLHRTG